MTEPQAAQQTEHRDFLNKYYGASRWFYDVTRKYYLFGRDRVLEQLSQQSWHTLVEIGPGTGRNLRKIQASKSNILLGGVEASDAMLEYAKKRVPGIHWKQGFAEDTDYTSLLGRRPDRVLFSYCLSMVQEREAAIERARQSLSPRGEVVIVDFADLSGLPKPFGPALRKWLEAFHVQPLDHDFLSQFTDNIEYGPGRYFVIARIPPLAE
jgi:S-adenosylmethionine-diacylgycerolhomoserine-N-methlytransferase